MKTKMARILFSLMCACVTVVNTAAVFASEAPSILTVYQPKVPKSLQK